MLKEKMMLEDKAELDDSVALRRRLKNLSKDVRFLIENKLSQKKQQAK